MPETKEKLKDLLNRSELTQIRVAKAIGMSTAVVSQWLGGTYMGDEATVRTKVAEFLRSHMEKEDVRTMGYRRGEIVHTANLGAVIGFCKRVKDLQEFGLIVGDAGLGKTVSLKSYCKTDSTAILVEADHGYTAMSLFKEICHALRIEPRKGLHDILIQIVERLRDSGRLLIIDEAEHLPYRALELIRRIHDKAEIGVVLCGMPRLRDNICGDRSHYAQLYSRLGAVRKVDPLSHGDVEAVAGTYLGMLSPDQVADLARYCRGSARVLTKLCRTISDIMRLNPGRSMDGELIAKAFELISVHSL